jgi:hypothetical protein
MIGPTETRTITIHVSETVYAKLITKARTESKTPALYAKLLFEAAWAARCGKAEGDPILVDCVDKSLRRGTPAEPPARAPKPVAPPPVVQLLPVPVIVPVAVPIAVPMTVEAPAEPISVHITGSQPLTPDVVEPLATLIGTAIAKFSEEAPVRSPSRSRLGLNRSIRAMAAAGNDEVEITEALGCSLDDVREAMEAS